MKEILEKYSLPIKIILGIIVLLIGLYVASLLKPSLGKKFYNNIKEGLTEKTEGSKKVYDSIEALRQSDYLKYIDALNELEERHRTELAIINNSLKHEKQKNTRIKKQLDDYRNGDFDKRFNVFSNTYNPKDKN